MAADQNAREKLARFLDEQAFDPILRADPERYSGSDRQKLEHVDHALDRGVADGCPCAMYATGSMMGSNQRTGTWSAVD